MVVDSYGKNLFTAGQLMLNDMYGRQINTEGRLSAGATWDPNLLADAVQFNELILSGALLNWEGGNYNPDKINYMEMFGTPNPFGVGTEAAPQFQGSGLTGYDFRENQYKRHRTNNWTLDNNETKIWGRHEIQFGGHFRQDQLDILPDQT